MGISVPVSERFWNKVSIGSPTACWLWTASQTSTGYGQINVGGRPHKAHRVAYELAVGPIPDGLQLDHVKARGCTSRLCVNPAHLEPVTNRENTLRGTAGDQELAKTHCPQGHPYSGANLYLRPPKAGRSGRGRECRSCVNAAGRRLRLRQKVTNGI